jgi:hypothetical protein
MRKRLILGFLIIGILCLASSAWSVTPTPRPFEHDARTLGSDALWDPNVPINMGKSGFADTVWIKVYDDSSCSYTGNPLFGTRAARTPGWATWCFDGGLGDSCSDTGVYGSGLPGCWTHYDAHVFGKVNLWHVDTYDTYLPGSEDSSMWCGELGDTLTWDYPPGYGPGITFSLVADLGTAANFTASGGMTLGGVHLFAVELAYDYCFLEIGAADIPDTASCREIGRFNGISNPDSVNCRGLPQSYWGTTAPSGIGNGTWPYLCADWTPFSAVLSAATMASVGQNGTEHLFVRWRAEADFLWDDQTGGAPPVGADTPVRGESITSSRKAICRRTRTSRRIRLEQTTSTSSRCRSRDARRSSRSSCRPPSCRAGIGREPCGCTESRRSPTRGTSRTRPRIRTRRRPARPRTAGCGRRTWV